MQNEAILEAGNTLPPLPSAERLQELLFDAARIGRVDVLPALVSAGADIEARDGKGYTPLILASYNGHEAATELLIDLGAPVDQPDEVRGNTPLMGTAFKGFGSIAARLLDGGADPNAVNKAGQTALMMASLFGHCRMVELLLSSGADTRIVDAAGNDAISVAREQNNHAMVRRLTEANEAR